MSLNEKSKEHQRHQGGQMALADSECGDDGGVHAQRHERTPFL